MPIVKVSLDPNANPPVTVDQQTLEVSSGLQTIIWEPASGQTFTFPSNALTGLPDPPFSQAQINGNGVSVSDNNGANYQNLYAYTLTVTSNGQNYSTARRPDPTQQSAQGPFIRNR